MKRTWMGQCVALFSALLSWLALAPVAAAQPVIESVSPARQRVYEMITLRGQGFGSYDPATSDISFQSAAEGGGTIVSGGMPYVWRDDFIQISVPVPLPAGAGSIQVVTSEGTSTAVGFERIGVAGAALDFIQKSRLSNDADVTRYLGQTSFNMARTKDAEIGDVNGDGLPDLLDNNSNNMSNGTHGVMRTNQAGLFFRAIDWEPVNAADIGNFAVTVLPGGNYVGDAVAYDADLVDLNNDGLPDWIQAASQAVSNVRIAINNYQGVPGRFVEATSTWFTAPPFPGGGSPDDIGHTDVNFDGYVDVAAAFRFTNEIQVYLNAAGQTFGQTIEVNSIPGASAHDVFFLDANGDRFPDVAICNESGPTRVFHHNGDLANPGFTAAALLNTDSLAGLAADLNADGLDDIALGGFPVGMVFLNNPGAPGTFTGVQLPDVVSYVYDMEAGDIDLDGDVDLVGAIITTNAQDTARVWLNNGDGTFVNATSPGAGVVLPGVGPYQRLSADLIDSDMDGDLDLYLTGADGTGVFGFGAVANQYWENRILGLSLEVGGSCPNAVSLTVKGATPSSPVVLLQGQAPVLRTLGGGPCAGTTVGVRPQLLGVVQADANGEFSAQAALPPAVCNRFVEALDLASCNVTSVGRLP